VEAIYSHGLGRGGQALNQETRTLKTATIPTIKTVKPIRTFSTVEKDSLFSFDRGNW